MHAIGSRHGLRVSLSVKGLGDHGTEVIVDPLTGWVRGCREAECYEFRLDGDMDCRLWVDEVELAPTTGHAGKWIWVAGFHAGEVEAELRDARGMRLATWKIDVSPDPSKLGRDAYEQMLADIAELDPRLLLGHEASTVPIGVDCTLVDANVDYSRLRRHAESAVSALRRVLRSPRTCLTTRRARVPMRVAKRFDASTVAIAFREPGALALLDAKHESIADASVTFDVSVTEEATDSPANRAMLATLDALQRRSRELRRTLEIIASQTPGSDARDALVARMPARREFFDRLDGALQALRRVPPFSSVTRREVSAAGLNAISADPIYAAAYRHAWRALRRGVAGSRDHESTSTIPTWQVFERWCFVRVTQMLQSKLPGLTWSRRFPRSVLDAIVFEGEDSRRRIEVHLQPRFPAWDQSSRQGFYSLSRERYPDIVITVRDHHGKRFAVLDAKYRVRRPYVLEAMESAHIYRDGLRWASERPALALLLVPAHCETDWLESPDFIAEHAVGVASLSLGDEPTKLDSHLDELLADVRSNS